MSCCVLANHHQRQAAMMCTCMGGAQHEWWHDRLTCWGHTLPMQLNDSEKPGDVVQLAAVWLIARNRSMGSHTKASDFRECSPSVELSALADSKESQSFEDVETCGVNIHRLMMDCSAEIEAYYVYISRFSDDVRLQLNEDYSFQIRHPSSALSSRTCQITLSIAATGWCTRKVIFCIMPLKHQPLLYMQWIISKSV